MKKIVSLLLILMLTASIALSRNNSGKEDSVCYSQQDNKIIAQTFNENNYLKQRVDTLESLQLDYKKDISLYQHKDSLLNYKVNLMDGVVVTQSVALRKLSFSYNDLLKQSNKSKIFNGVLIGGITVSLATTIYLIFKPK